MMRFILLANLIWFTGLAAAQSVESEPLSESVPIWVDELDAPDARTRREAERQLIQAGPAAAQFIPAITDHLSIEARERLARVKEKWSVTKTTEQTDSIVVRFGDAKTFGEAFEAISTASGIEFETEMEETRSFIPPTAPLGFWHAVDWVLDQAELDINFYSGDRTRLSLVPRDPERPSRVDSAAYAGIYRLEPTIVTARRVLSQPSLSGLNITLTISWQPNRTPIGLTLPMNELSARLDNDAKLLPQASSESIDVATSSEIAQSEFFLPMQLPEGNALSVRRISGVIKALLPGDRTKFELPLKDPAARVQADKMTVALEQVRVAEPLHEVRVAVTLDEAGRSLESHRQWIFENEAYVKMGDGTRLEHLGYEVFRQTNDGVGIGYLFDLGGAEIPDGSVLVYESPTSVVTNEVPFILNEVPLP